MELALSGKIALVTGASEGIGRAIAEALAAEGVHLCVCARRAAPLQDRAAALERQHGVPVLAVPADLSTEAGVEALAGAHRARFGALDILVNNAGSIRAGSLITKPEAEWQEDFALKFWGYVRLTRAVWPWLVERGGGRVLNIVGGAGRQPSAGYLAGGAANAGLMNLTKALGDEGAPHGILVNAINPGAVRTARWQSLMQRQAAERGISVAALEAEQLAHVPLRRGGEPEEIAAAAVFLCSGAASYITGTTLQVDGGYARCI
ncbi:MAG: SDR family NAD(P)-dependent oxidoreductase [Pseudomonadota bacterium]